MVIVIQLIDSLIKCKKLFKINFITKNKFIKNLT